MPGRPEELIPAEFFYNATEAKKYVQSTRMATIQRSMAKRAFEMLNFPKKCAQMTILDIGCGTGLSGEVIERQGHKWIGCDISKDMLEQAVANGAEGDLIEMDIGEGLPFRPGMFDGAISVSVIQWLCVAYTKAQNPRLRLRKFFTSLYQCLRQGARAVLQFYPKNEEQIRMINDTALKCGFGGGLVVDFPNSTRKRKYFLVLWAGLAPNAYAQEIPAARGTGDDMMEDEDEDEDDSEEDEEGEEGEEDEEDSDASEAGTVDPFSGERGTGKRKVNISERQKKAGRKKDKKKNLNVLSRKQWVKWSKERRKVKGQKVAYDSKYTGRKRKPKF